MTKKIIKEKVEKTVKQKKVKVDVCEPCVGTGRGLPNGVFVTTCTECEGTGAKK